MNIPFGSRTEVMQHLEGFVSQSILKFLKPIDTNWQPADFLPDSSSENFAQEIKLIQEQARGLSYDTLAILVGDTITEEALPTYESWLFCVDGVNPVPSQNNPWKQWVKRWTAEENRHGDLLNRYLYLSGRINMREFETSTQYLIADGFDIETGKDPYRNFIYTSFQELATNISHRRVATLAKQQGDIRLSKICGVIAADEARHAKAYAAFIDEIFKIDPSQMMLAFEDMMRKKIVMPAHFLRETGMQVGDLWGHFTDAAQRLGVYTATDYANILRDLNQNWQIDKISSLTDQAEKARDYLMALPDRLNRVAERMKTPQLEYQFKWIAV